MRLLKTHVLLRLLNSYLVDSPQPANISYLWNFGSLLGTCLIIQILSGCFLAMHYTPNIDLAFNSVEHIMRDVNNGWILRYTHANVASFFFIFVYLHVARGLYYSSYKSPRTLVWSIGVIILILMMAIAFLGYVSSPKWFDKSIFYVIILIIAYYILSFLSLKKIRVCWLGLQEQEKYPIENRIKNIKYIKLSNKSLYLINSISLKKMGYSTISHLNKSVQISSPPHPFGCCPAADPSFPPLALIPSGGKESEQGGTERLNTIMKELGLNPVYIYENLDKENIKTQILNETKALSGIYMIVNKITKDYYIGSASTNRFYARFSNHVIYFRGSKIVKSAVKKYELKNFAFLILDLYPNVVTKENNKELLDLEDKYLKLLLPNYNILTEAGSSFGYKHTEVDRIKMINIYSDDRSELTAATKEIIGSLNRGKHLSPEIIEKMRYKALNRPPMSNLTKKKCISNTRPIVLYNLNGTVYGKYSSILEAAKSINCCEKTIRRALKTEKRLVKKQ